MTINVVNVPPTADGLTNFGPYLPGTGVTLQFVNPNDAAADLPSLKYDFDLNHDGLFNAADGPGYNTNAATLNLTPAQVTASASYLNTQGVYTIKGRMRNKDGGISAIYSTDVYISTITGGNGGVVTTHFVAVGSDASTGLASQVRVYDTAGTLLTTTPLQPLGPKYTAGYRVATGDVTGDHIEDVIVAPGVGGGRTIYVYDGSDLTKPPTPITLPYAATFNNGVTVATADFDRDGYADIIVAPGAGQAPIVTISERTGATLFSLSPFGSAYTAGYSVAAADVNGDLVPDLIVGQAGSSTLAGMGSKVSDLCRPRLGRQG